MNMSINMNINMNSRYGSAKQNSSASMLHLEDKAVE